MSKTRSSKSQERSVSNKENIESEKRREDLCKLLLSKFQDKYPFITKPVILNKINSFLDTNPVTLDNLETLEDSILAAVGKYKPNNNVNIEHDKVSVMSGATEFMYKKKDRSRSKGFLRTKTRIRQSENVDENTEEAEWADIMKFNTKLYQEEVRQDRLNKARQKRYMMMELNRQVEEKKEIARAEKKEEESYLKFEEMRLKHLNDLEKMKNEERKMKIKEEKMLRDKQLKGDALRKRMEEAESKAKDKQMMLRMKEEQLLESKAEMERKQIERETIRKMMEESLKIKEELKALGKIEMEEDIKRLVRQKEISELQEKEWKENMKRKDERNRLLIESSLRTGGAKKLKEQELAIYKQIQDQMAIIEKKQVEEEEVKLEMFEKVKRGMKSMLDKQVQEKKLRKQQELNEGLQQAEMWNKENELGKQQEAINMKKLKDANKKHQDYLLKQMEQVRRNRGRSIMTQQEYLINKKLITELKTNNEN